MLGEFSVASSLPQPYTSHQKLKGHPFGELPQDEFGNRLSFLLSSSTAPWPSSPGCIRSRRMTIPVSMLCLICPRRSSQQRITMAESGIMHRSFRAVFDNGAAVRLSTSCMKSSLALLMFIRRHSSSSLRWLAGSLFQSFRSSSRAAAESLLPESGKHLLTLAGGRIPRIGDPAFLSGKAHLPDQP